MSNDEIQKSVLKTGTLTVGIICKDGIVVAADKRQTYASGGGVAYIARTAKKIQEINERIVVTTAGNASDSRKVIDILKAELRLKELRTKRKVTVSEAAALTANMLFQNIRTPSMIPSIAHFLAAGFDDEGSHLFEVSADGYLEEISTYVATGSGMMQAHPILDSDYKKGMNVEDGTRLAMKCINASMGRDPGVGDGIDVYVIRKDKFEQVLDQMVSKEIKESK